MAKASDIITAFNAASADDLEALRAQIAGLEKQTDGLRAIEKALAVRIHGRKPRKSPAKAVPSANGDGLDAKRRKVLVYLMANGAKPMSKIADACGINSQGPGCLSKVLEHAWFHKAPDGMVTLSSLGDREARIEAA